MDQPHSPVLLGAVLEFLPAGECRRLVDGTVGGGGHAAALLERHPGLELLGIDRDEHALAIARRRLAPFEGRTTLVQSHFSRFGECMDKLGWQTADMLLFDIGVSSMQLDQPERGFSYRHDGPIDMRMGGEGETALELMERLDESELADVIYRYGEERFSRRIARRIKEALAGGSLSSTTDLAKICAASYPRGRHRLDPAARTFQALRIAINDELGELERMLDQVPDRLASGGRLGVICFHSLEDRMVKQRLLKWKQESRAKIITKKPIRADRNELERNPRASSAKLRVCQWL